MSLSLEQLTRRVNYAVGSVKKILSGTNTGIRRAVDLSTAYDTLKNGEVGVFQIGFDVFQVGKTIEGGVFNSALYIN